MKTETGKVERERERLRYRPIDVQREGEGARYVLISGKQRPPPHESIYTSVFDDGQTRPGRINLRGSQSSFPLFVPFTRRRRKELQASPSLVPGNWLAPRYRSEKNRKTFRSI